jgi:hypothetical protein
MIYYRIFLEKKKKSNGTNITTRIRSTGKRTKADLSIWLRIRGTGIPVPDRRIVPPRKFTEILTALYTNFFPYLPGENQASADRESDVRHANRSVRQKPKGSAKKETFESNIHNGPTKIRPNKTELAGSLCDREDSWRSRAREEDPGK